MCSPELITTAAAPAVAGDAALVPLKHPAPVVRVVTHEAAERSGFVRPSLVGPQELYDAIVVPAAGSTAAQRSAGGKVLPLESDKLQLVVREPYTPKGERYRLRTFTVGPGEPIVVRSKMREAVIFLDGPDLVVKPEFGDVITFARSSEPLSLLGLATRRSVSSKRD